MNFSQKLKTARIKGGMSLIPIRPQSLQNRSPLVRAPLSAIRLIAERGLEERQLREIVSFLRCTTPASPQAVKVAV